MNIEGKVKDMMEKNRLCSWSDSYLRFLISELKQSISQKIHKAIKDFDHSQIAILFNTNIHGYPILKYYFTFDQEVKFKEKWKTDCKDFHPELEDNIYFSTEEKMFFKEVIIRKLKDERSDYFRELIRLSFGIESPAIIKKSLAANIMYSSGGNLTFTYWENWAELPLYRQYPDEYPKNYFLIEKRLFNNSSLILCTSGNFAIFIAFKRALKSNEIAIFHEILHPFFKKNDWLNDLIWLMREEIYFVLEQYELHSSFIKYVEKKICPILLEYIFNKNKNKEKDIIKIFEEFITKQLKNKYEKKEEGTREIERKYIVIAKLEPPSIDDSKLYDLVENKPSYVGKIYNLRNEWLSQKHIIWGLFNNIPEMALHNEIHSENLEKLLTYFNFKNKIFFYLWSAIWLHDVGLFDYAEKISQYISTKKVVDSFSKVRKLHGKIAYERINKDGKKWGLSEEDIQIIATICRYHTSESNKELEKEIKELINFGAEKRLPLIFFIFFLRILDALDIQIRRWQDSFEKIHHILHLSKDLKRKDLKYSEHLRKQVIHFIKHSSFISIVVDKKGEIVYLPNFEMPLILLIYSFIKVQEDIEKELNTINEIIKKNKLKKRLSEEFNELIKYKKKINEKIKIGRLTVSNRGKFQIKIRCFDPVEDDFRSMCKIRYLKIS